MGKAELGRRERAESGQSRAGLRWCRKGGEGKEGRGSKGSKAGPVGIQVSGRGTLS